jgi:hypothetical protein
MLGFSMGVGTKGRRASLFLSRRSLSGEEELRKREAIKSKPLRNKTVSR